MNGTEAQFSARSLSVSTARADDYDKRYDAGRRFWFIFAVCPLLVSCGAKNEMSKSTNVTSSEAEDPYEERRHQLVDSFTTGRRPEVSDERVIAAMRNTPRHAFVPENLRHQAYLDKPLPVGHGQTISQPSLVAKMTEKLDPQPGERILEIGTGSGYQAAILSELVAEVYTIEIVAPLGERARDTFERLGYKNIHCRIGNGYLGWPEAAPFDAIIVTCAPDDIPPALVEQLSEGGRMVIPVGPQDEVQELYLLEKRGVHVEKRAILPVRFVPMTGEKAGD